MRWSKLKQRIEATFVDSVHGRVAVHLTAYRKSSWEDDGEGWITFDKRRVESFATFSFLKVFYDERDRLETRPLETPPFSHDRDYLTAFTNGQGVFSAWDFTAALTDYLNLSIDDALASDRQIVQSLAMLDARTGKRRLRAIAPDQLPAMVKRMLEIRQQCDAEATGRKAK